MLQQSKQDVQQDFIQEDRGEVYAELFTLKDIKIKDLLLFYDWLCVGDVEDEVCSFVQKDGLNILIVYLARVELETQQNLEYNTQVLLLKIFLELIQYDDVREDIPQLQGIVNSITLCLSLVQVEVTSIVLDILTVVRWNCHEGYEIVQNSLSNLQVIKNYHYTFEPFLLILEQVKSIVMVFNICAFLNILIESPSDKEKRIQLKEDLVLHGISVVYGDIKLKISDGNYQVNDCSQMQQRIDLEILNQNPSKDNLQVENMLLDPNKSKILYIDDSDKEKFGKFTKLVKTQIDVFLELLIELDDDCSSDSSDNSESCDDLQAQSKRSQRNTSSSQKQETRNISFSEPIMEESNNAEDDNSPREYIKKSTSQPKVLNPVTKNNSINLDQLSSSNKGNQQETLDFENGLSKKESQGKGQKLSFRSGQKPSDVQIAMIAKKTQRRGLLGQARQSVLQPSDNHASTLQQVAQMLQHSNNKNIDNGIQTVYLQNEVVEGLKSLYRDIRNADLISDVQQVMSDFLNTMRKDGVNIYTKLIEVIHQKISLFVLNSGVNKSRKHIDSNDQLKLENIHLGEKTLSLDLEIQKLCQEKDVQNKAMRDQYNKIQKLQLENDEVKRQLEKRLEQKNENPDAMIQKGLVQAQILKIQQSLELIQDTASQNKNIQLLKLQLEGQREVIKMLKDQLNQQIMTPGTEKNQDIKQIQIECQNNYNNQMEGQINAWKRNQQENKIQNTLLTQQKHDLQYKLMDATSEIYNLKEQLDNEKKRIKQNPTQVMADVINETPKQIQGLPPLSAPPPPPPPPPIGVKIAAQPKRERQKPTLSTKTVTWNAFKKDTIQSTVWEGIDDSKIQLNFKQLEELFSLKPSAGNQSLIPRKEPKLSKLKVDRQRNVEIVLSKLKISNYLVSQALWGGDTTILTKDLLESLIKIIPNESEALLYINHEFDREKMATPDLFFIELVKIPMYDARLQSLFLFHSFKDTVTEIKSRLLRFIDLAEQQLKDENFRTLLIYSLAVGNFLNGSSNRAEAYGFRMFELEKLFEIKSNDGKITLLMYIVEQVEKEKNLNFVNLNDRLEDYEFLQKTQVNQFAVDINEIIQQVKSVNIALKSQTQNDNDKIKEKLFSLYVESQGILSGLEQDLKNALYLYEKLCSYYCENQNDITSDVFFQKIYQYKQNCKSAKTQILRIKMLQETEEQRQKLLELKRNKQALQSLKHWEEKAVFLFNDHKVLLDHTNLKSLQTEDKEEILIELRNRQNSKIEKPQQATAIVTNKASLSQLMAMQKQLKSTKK